MTRRVIYMLAGCKGVAVALEVSVDGRHIKVLDARGCEVAESNTHDAARVDIPHTMRCKVGVRRRPAATPEAREVGVDGGEVKVFDTCERVHTQA